MGWLVDCAVAKVNKHASRESGDTAEVVERPGGGVSLVAVDGQGSGRAAKTLSLLLSARAVSLLKDGVRDGAVARAVHDHLFAYRYGQVSATLDILSVDLRTKTVLVTRNASAPLLVGRAGRFEIAPCTAEPIGLYPRTRPVVWELPLEDQLRVVVCTDGVAVSGRRTNLPDFDLAAFAQASSPSDASATDLADLILGEAIRRDQERPTDDMTVLALVIRADDAVSTIRRMSVSFAQA